MKTRHLWCLKNQFFFFSLSKVIFHIWNAIGIIGHYGEAKKLTECPYSSTLQEKKKKKHISASLNWFPPSSSHLRTANLVWVPRWVCREAGQQHCSPEIPIWLTCFSALWPGRTSAGGAWIKTTLIWSSPLPLPLNHKSGVDSGDYGDGLWCQYSKFKDALWKINK